MKLTKKSKKQLKQLAGKLSFKSVATFFVCLVLGIGVGVGTYFVISQNDTFEILGTKNINLDINPTEDYTYTEQGVKIISFGRDLSNDVIITTNINNNIIDLSKKGVYYVKYTVQDIKYGSVVKVRTITVGGEA